MEALLTINHLVFTKMFCREDCPNSRILQKSLNNYKSKCGETPFGVHFLISCKNVIWGSRDGFRGGDWGQPPINGGLLVSLSHHRFGGWGAKFSGEGAILENFSDFWKNMS